MLFIGTKEVGRAERCHFLSPSSLGTIRTPSRSLAWGAEQLSGWRAEALPPGSPPSSEQGPGTRRSPRLAECGREGGSEAWQGCGLMADSKAGTYFYNFNGGSLWRRGKKRLQGSQAAVYPNRLRSPRTDAPPGDGRRGPRGHSPAERPPKLHTRVSPAAA